MKTTIEVAPFNKAVQSLRKNVNSKNTLPILDCLLFEFKQNVLSLTASDMETIHTMQIDVKNEIEASFAVPVDILAETIKNIPDATIDVEFTQTHMIITTFRGVYEIPTDDALQFPKTPQIATSEKIVIACKTFNEVIQKAVKFSGDDDLRPVLSAVYVAFQKDEIIFAATDSHKLFKFQLNQGVNDDTKSIVIPKKAAMIIAGLIVADDVVEITFNDTNAIFKYENQTVVIRLVDGKYPNFEAVIPKNNQIEAVVNLKEILGSLKRTSAYSNKTTHQVILDISNTEIKINSTDVDFSRKAQESIPCDSNDSITIGFNSRFLIECLNVFDCENVKLLLSSPQRAMLIKTVEVEESEDLTVLTMPVLIQR